MIAVVADGLTPDAEHLPRLVTLHAERHQDRQDLRGLALVERRALLRKHLKHAVRGAILFSDNLDGSDGEAMFRHACAMGLEGIVSKRADSRYKSGRCLSWVKIKNPAYERR